MSSTVSAEALFRGFDRDKLTQLKYDNLKIPKFPIGDQDVLMRFALVVFILT